MQGSLDEGHFYILAPVGDRVFRSPMLRFLRDLPNIVDISLRQVVIKAATSSYGAYMR